MAHDMDFQLVKWLTSNGPNAVAVVGGSATPYLSLQEIVSLSSDPETTKAAFDIMNRTLSLTEGGPTLQKTIAEIYDQSRSNIEARNVIVTNAATGANHVVQRSLLKAGDHVICQYPIYGPLLDEPKDIGCEMSYLRLDPADNWSLDLEQLKALIKPGKTKMLILNNPANPTGTHLSTELQREIIQIAKQHDIVIHCDEIFRPLFHTDETPASMIEHADLDYDKVVTTSSLSKAYGLSGVRLGWIATRSQRLMDEFTHYRMFTCQFVSTIDEAIATEVLSSRCRPAILQKHFSMAKANLDLVQSFIDEHSEQCEWVRPTAGSVGFVKFKNHRTGQPVDDIEFCKRLMDSKKVLMAPASSCFDLGDRKGEFEGRTRMHFTVETDTAKKALTLLGEFLDEEKDRMQ
ncbi:hypothetical protein PMZ80_000213 [Knufia obscura]|uniref:Aminotransferase class I/classII large domain-containing protein n=1 Tax=Knufia obscura TaxID=1635080 RepID=A0ABR0S173_9EURO|nr:hypothetical protein PMZ80_000213 [Knufia obscura]